MVHAVAALAVGVAWAGEAATQEVVELPGRDRPMEAAVQPVYSVGGAMAEADWQIFGELVGSAALAFDGKGNLHVFDRDNYRVVVLGPDGRLVREFGKEGEGPGEWRMPLAMSVLRDGTVVITDVGHRAYLVYGSDGQLLRTVPIGGDGGGFSVARLQPDPRGGHLYGSVGGMMQVRINDGGDAGPESPGRRIERLSLDDGSRAPFFTAWEPPREESSTTLRSEGATFRINAGGPRAFEPDLHVGVLPDGGLAVVDSSAYTVKIVGPDGALRRVVRRPSVRAREVTGRIERSERERRLEELEAGDGPRMRVVVSGPGGGSSPISDDQIKQMQRSRIEQLEFYPRIPAISWMRTGWDGKLWIERTPEEWWEDGPVDILTPTGDYLGTLPAEGVGIPAAFGPDGLVAHLERDELDVPTVVVGRLPPPLR